MRALLLILALLPGGGSTPAGPGDGTISVRDARGMVQLSARGSITGRFDRGKVMIVDPNPYDRRRPIVFGQEKTVYRSATTTVYSGKDVRFRVIGTSFQVRVEGRGIFLSAVGRGRGLIQGSGNPQAGIYFDGAWSLNDEEYRSLPDELTGFALASSTPTG